MCGKKDGSSNIAVTGSSNQGHGTCCKPDNVSDTHCQDKGDYICSQPVLASDGADEWKAIATGGKNMQMIAYCPLIKPATCGLTSNDHKIIAKPHAEGATKISLENDAKL